MQRMDVDGVQIAYDRRGSGPPLLLLHGLPGNRRIWRRQLEGLADDFTVVAWDAPGNGASSDPSRPPDLTVCAQVLAGFIEALGFDRPHLAGLSWGGGLALELHRIAPEVPRSLVITSGYAGWAGSLPPDEVDRRLESYLAAARSDPVDAVRGFRAGYFSASAPAHLFDEVEELLVDYHPAAFESLARSFAETDLRPTLATIDVPTLLLYGDADVRAPLEVAHHLHASIPGAELVVVPGVGHLLNMEAPQRFDDELRRFLLGR